MFTSKLSPEQWAEARRLRAGGAKLAIIAERFGISVKTVGDRARKEGWVAPGKPRAAPVRSRLGKSPALPPATVAIRRRIAQRLYTIVDNQLEKMELRMQKQLNEARKAASEEDAEMPAGDEEKENRILATVIKTIDQVTELDPDLNRAADGGAKPGDTDAASEADAFRREIAERIEKLIPPS